MNVVRYAISPRCPYWKTALQIIIIRSDLIDFCAYMYNPIARTWGQNSNRKTVKKQTKKNSTSERLWFRGATLPSCKVTRAIQNVPDQPESVCGRPAIVTLFRPVEFYAIPQPRIILDTWHHWHNTGRVFVTRDFCANFGRLFDHASDRILTSDVHHRTLRNKIYRIRRCGHWMGFSCSWPLDL